MKFSCKKAIATIALFLFGVTYAQSGGQTTQVQKSSQTPPSPEAFKFAKYGEIPVNESSGNATVDIPLYTFKAGRIEIPITMRHTGGAVKVDEMNSWTGIKWDLNVGGIITRTVNDLPDERTSPDNRIFHTVPSLHNFIPNQSTQLAKLADSGTDSEVDIFNYNFLGYSGSFYFDENMVPRLIKYDKELKIELSANPIKDGVTIFNRKTITITTADGTKYFFGGLDASESTKIRLAAGDLATESQTSFYLYKIENYYKETVTFQYKLLGPSMEIIGMNQRLTKDVEVSACPGENYDLTTKISPANYYYLSTSGKVYLEKIIAHKDNSSVAFSCSLQDNNNLNRYILNSITVQNNQNTLIKKIEFKYTIPNSAHSYKRYFLNTILLMENSGTVVNNSYAFEYHSLESLPERFSMQQDYAGYYNGKQNTSLIPYTDDVFYISNRAYFGDRSINPTLTLCGTLKKVTYPTKGYTEFEYETAYNNTNTLLQFKDIYRPGVRIKRIKNYADPLKAPLITRYYYNKLIHKTASTDSFLGTRIPVFDGETRIRKSCSNASGNMELKQRYRESDSRNNLYNDANSGFYEFVTVSYGGDDFEKGGKEMQFHIQSDTPAKALTFSDLVSISKKESNDSMLNGTLLKEVYFPATPQVNIATGEITNRVKEITNTYLIMADKSKTMINCVADKVHDIGTYTGTTDPNLYVGNYYFGYYSTFSKWHTIEKTTVKEYFSTNAIQTSTQYYYDNKLAGLPTAIETSRKDGDLLKTENTYPSTTVEPSLYAAFKIEEPITVKNYKNGELISTNHTVYKINPLGTSYPTLPSVWQTQKGSSASSTLENRVFFTQYDDASNLVESYSNTSGLKTAYIWGYNKTVLIAKIENAAYADVAQEVSILQQLSNDNDSDGLTTALQALRNKLPNAFVTTYTYKPMIGITTITDPKGDVITYDYDNYGRLLNVKDKNGKILSTYKYHYKN